jgi:hypothetical protein
VLSAVARFVQEKIRSPAIGFGKDVVGGAHHYDAFEKARAQDLIDADTDYSDLMLDVFGFTTNNGRFVSREEAYNIARASGRVKQEEPAQSRLGPRTSANNNYLLPPGPYAPPS